MLSIGALAVVTVAWVLVGYSLAFAHGGAFVGGFGRAFLHGVGFAPLPGMAIPQLLFMVFEAAFCVLTAALVSGAVVERMRFDAFLVFAVLWSVLVYAVLAHWVWGGGWLQQHGALDFAGGVPVEMGSGFSALAAATVVGARRDYGRRARRSELQDGDRGAEQDERGGRPEAEHPQDQAALELPDAVGPPGVGLRRALPPPGVSLRHALLPLGVGLRHALVQARTEVRPGGTNLGTQLRHPLFELGLEFFEQGESVRGRAGKTRNDAVVMKFPDFARAALHHGLA